MTLATNPKELAAEAGLNIAAEVTSTMWGAGMSGILTDFTPGEAKLLLEGLVSPETQVQVAVGQFHFDGQVLFCERRNQQFEAHISIDDVDETGLRRTPRFPVHIPAKAFAPALAEPCEATIVDISGDGLGLETTVVLEVGSNVAVESDATLALGIVRFSREISPGHARVGVQLHHIVRQPAKTQPQLTSSNLFGKLRFSFAKAK